jgi:hypothetical protein
MLAAVIGRASCAEAGSGDVTDKAIPTSAAAALPVINVLIASSEAERRRNGGMSPTRINRRTTKWFRKERIVSGWRRRLCVAA